MASASVWAVAAIALVTMTGCTANDSNVDPNNPSAARQPRRCFSARDVRNFAPVNSSTVNIRVGRDIYRVDTFGTCRDLNWTNRMAMVTTGGSMICVGSGLGTSIVVNGPSGRQTCQVTAITALTPEQIQALPARERP